MFVMHCDSSSVHTPLGTSVDAIEVTSTELARWNVVDELGSVNCIATVSGMKYSAA